MIKIPEKIQNVIDTLCQNGYEAYIVGGCVRDFLLGKAPTDYDVTTSACPEAVISLFDKTIPTGIKHGTVTVKTGDEFIEVTTFRSDGSYTDSRHPESVEFVTSLKKDLERRDFTVNAMAYNKKCGLRDYFGGKKDLENKVLKAVGDPETRFSEDALRILRLYRFASVLGFSAEKETEKAAVKLSGNLENISRERIAAELKKTVTGENISAVKPLIESGGLKFLGVKDVPDFDILKKLSYNADLSLFAFLKLSGCDMKKIGKELKLSNTISDYFTALDSLLKYDIPKTKTDIKIMLGTAKKPCIFEDYMKLISASGNDISGISRLFNEIHENSEPYLISHLKIDGNHLRAMGFEGEKIGEILNKLLKAVISERVKNQRSELKNYIKNL